VIAAKPEREHRQTSALVTELVDGPKGPLTGFDERGMVDA
jgi:hypothetical protein